MNPLEKEIQRRLEELDSRLFLSWEQHPVYGFLYWSVRRHMDDAGGEKPEEVVGWYVGSTPLPLSMDLLDRVRSQEGDIREAISQSMANNAALKELRRQEALAEQDQIIDEWKGRSKKFLS